MISLWRFSRRYKFYWQQWFSALYSNQIGEHVILCFLRERCCDGALFFCARAWSSGEGFAGASNRNECGSFASARMRMPRDSKLRNARPLQLCCGGSALVLVLVLILIKKNLVEIHLVRDAWKIVYSDSNRDLVTEILDMKFFGV